MDAKGSQSSEVQLCPQHSSMLNNIESTGMLMRAKATSTSALAMKGNGMDQQHKWRCMRGWTEPARHDGYADYAIFSIGKG